MPSLIVWVAFTLAVVVTGPAELARSSAPESSQTSIGGAEHDDNILGINIGMDVPTALKTIFDNSGRKPGQEKPDAKRSEGKDNRDVRVLYRGIKEGEVQILFAEAKWVREVLLVYAGPHPIDELRLPPASDIRVAMGGQRYDDRYTVGYTAANKLEKFWWRDENTASGYRVRVGFISGKHTFGGAQGITTIARKIISVTPGDEEKFLKVMAKQ